MKTIEARRAELILSYNGFDLSLDVAKDLLDFTYTDAPPGELDDLQINLQDRNNLWQSPDWMPLPGDSLKAEIRTHHWEKEGEVKKLPLGDFEVDSFQLTGAPDTVSIKGVSLGVGSSIRQEKRTKAWEKATLKTIAGEIAKRAGLKLSYNAPVNPTYDRLDQTEVSDLAFYLNKLKRKGCPSKYRASNSCFSMILNSKNCRWWLRSSVGEIEFYPMILIGARRMHHMSPAKLVIPRLNRRRQLRLNIRRQALPKSVLF